MNNQRKTEHRAMARRHRGRGVNATGRSERAERFWMLTFSMARSPAFRSLSGAAVKILVELRCRFDGENNGRLHLSYSKAAELLGMGKATIHRAFDELQEKGFVRQTKRGARHCRLASEWLCTDLPAAKGEPPSNDWRRWQPPPKFRTSVPMRNHDASDGSATEPIAPDCSATEPKNDPETPSGGSATELHIHSTMRSENHRTLRLVKAQ